MADLNATFRANVLAIARSRGLTVYRLGMQMFGGRKGGVQARMQLIARPDTGITLTTLQKYADALEVHPLDLLQAPGKDHIMTDTATDLPLHTADGIRALRTRLDMTQDRFAEVVGVSPRTVSGWERGELPPGPDRIARMRYLASDRTQRAVGLVATLREAATYFALDGSEGVARELRRIAANHEAANIDPEQVT